MNNSSVDFMPRWLRKSKPLPLLLLVVAFLFTCLPRTATAVKNRDFDHFNTGFPLSGEHLKVDCENCHIKGVFKGTPKLCAGCHNGRSALGKPSKHIVTTEACDDCHTTFGWERVIMDHTAVKGDCESCHAPYPRGHVPTASPCDDCHMTLSWESVRFDHALITTGCRICHANQVPSDHPPISASDDCDICHNTQTWQGARFDHSSASEPCSNCHADDKPADHIPTTEECGFCHSTIRWEGATP